MKSNQEDYSNFLHQQAVSRMEHSMFGSIADSLFGGIQPRTPNRTHDVRRPLVLEPGQTAYGYTFDWSPKVGEHCRATVGYYTSAKEADEVLAEVLIGMGYEEPRWWQFWRWGSQKLPDEVLAILRTDAPA